MCQAAVVATRQPPLRSRNNVRIVGAFQQAFAAYAVPAMSSAWPILSSALRHVTVRTSPTVTARPLRPPALSRLRPATPAADVGPTQTPHAPTPDPARRTSATQDT